MRARPLPMRRGVQPTTTDTNPHAQLDQQPETRAQRHLLAADLFALPGVEGRDSLISVPGARALCLPRAVDAPADAFLIDTEFAHLHPGQDQSLHVMLPPQPSDTPSKRDGRSNTPLPAEARSRPTRSCSTRPGTTMSAPSSPNSSMQHTSTQPAPPPHLIDRHPGPRTIWSRLGSVSNTSVLPHLVGDATRSTFWTRGARRHVPNARTCRGRASPPKCFG